MTTITLNTGATQTAIRVGEKLSHLRNELPAGRIIFIADENVYRLHKDLFRKDPVLTVPSGEASKTLGTVERLCKELLSLEADRKTFIVGVGGGLTCDVAGFAASVYMRGLSFGFISSTLLGQVDASVGGKNGVNLDGYKNMIGSFSQPSFVWCDLSLLDTLPGQEYISGLAEVIKYGLISSPELYTLLEQHSKSILHRDKEILEDIVSQCVRIKAGIVEEDELETGNRKLLNYGHTIGHAVERLSGMLHGQAISIGMVLAARLSERRGMLPSAEVERLVRLLSLYQLPVSCDIDPGLLFESMKKDKKRDGRQISFVLLEAPGKPVISPVEIDNFKNELNDLFKHQ